MQPTKTQQSRPSLLKAETEFSSADSENGPSVVSYQWKILKRSIGTRVAFNAVRKQVGCQVGNHGKRSRKLPVIHSKV